jgi:hypothetical protein
MCHCLACQQRTGSAFGVQARFDESQVSIEGESTEYAYVGDSGGNIPMHFCPKCGSTVYWRPDGMPESVVVAVGAFADPSFPAPKFAVYTARRHGWAKMPDLDVEEWE